MNKPLWLLLAALLLAVGAAHPALAQQISIAGWQAASLPCQSNVFIPVVPSGSPFVSQYISCNGLATTTGRQSLYNKTLISPTINGGALTAPAGSPVTFVGVNALGNIVTGTPAGGGNVVASSPTSGSLAVWSSGTNLGGTLPPTTPGNVALVSGNSWTQGQLQFTNLGGAASTTQLVPNLPAALAGIFSTTGTVVNVYGQTSTGTNVLVPLPSGGGGSGTISGLINGQVPVASGPTSLNASIPYGTSGATILVESDTGGHINSSLLAPGAALTNIGTGGVTSAYLAPSAALGNIGPGGVTSAYLGPGAALQNIGTLQSAQFVGFGATTGSGAAQIVTLQAGSGASFNCSNQVCTIGATGSGGISGPSSTVVGFAPLWNSGTGNALAAGLPVAQTGNSTIIETSPTGTIANALISALPNSSLANSQVTIGNTAILLGGTASSLSGLTLTAPTISNGSISGATIGNPTFTGTATFNSVAFSFGSDAPGDIYFRNSSGLVSRLGIATGVLTNVGGLPAWAPAPISGMNALTQDVTATGTGSQPATVVGIQSRPIASTAPTTNQVLTWSGSVWAPATSISGMNALTQDVTAAGTGSQTATVVGLQTRPIASTAPTTNQVLTWSGSVWAPTATQITGMNALTQDVTATGTGSQTATVVGLQTRPIASTAPTAGQLLGWGGSSWSPVNAPVTGMNALTQDVTAIGVGSQAATVVGLQGRPVAATTPTNAQMLGWNGSTWAPESAPPATGVTPGEYTVASASSTFLCETINPSGQVTSMLSGACASTAIAVGYTSGSAVGYGGGNAVGY